MRFTVDRDDALPVSRQLHRAIVRGIELGRLAAGDRLPSVRELADVLGLAPNTVAKAYRALVAEGYLEPRGRHGTFVAARASRAVRDADRRLDEAARRFARRGRQLGFGDDAIVRAAREALRRSPRNHDPDET